MQLKNKNIVLIGMPGSGKTTIGKKLGDKLCKSFYDSDEYIETSLGITINEIFKNGEEKFREIESDIIKELSKNKSCIISTGGGIVKKSCNINNLKENGIIFFIDRPVEEIVKDIKQETRPLIKDIRTSLYRLYDERYELYLKYCDFRICNDKDIDYTINSIIRVIKN